MPTWLIAPVSLLALLGAWAWRSFRSHPPDPRDLPPVSDDYLRRRDLYRKDSH